MKARAWLWLAAGVVVIAATVVTVVVLTRAREDHLRLTLLPGRSVWEAADAIEAQLPGARDAVLKRAADEAWVRAQGLPVKARAPRTDGVQDTWLEGFLYPETYFLPLDATPDDALARAVRQFKKVFAELETSHAAAFEALHDELGLGPADVVVLASLVEEETARRDEAPRIAGVFLNRLRKGMRLETDPTLMYRPERVAHAPTSAERKDATNPYNTYAVDGLPPGPICSPGRAALVAVLEAERHDFLYFVAKRDGTGASAFAATPEEHEANVERYLRGSGEAAKP